VLGPIYGSLDQQPIQTEATTLPFVIPSEPRISCYAVLEMATCAAFIEESRMKFADPTQLDKKSGEVEGSAVPPSPPNILVGRNHVLSCGSRSRL
jgi:hypothetical protein